MMVAENIFPHAMTLLLTNKQTKKQKTNGT